MKIFRSVVIVLFFYSGFAQHQPDALLEGYIKNDHLTKARQYVTTRLQSTDSLSLDQIVYYKAKAGFVLLRLGVFDSAMYYSKSALKQIDVVSTHHIKLDVWKSIAYSYCKFGNIDSATIYTQQLYKTVENTTNFEMIRNANVLMGIISFQNKLYQDSVDYYQKALEATIASKTEANYKVDYYNLGLSHLALKNHQQAIEYLLKAAQYAEQGNDQRLLIRVYGALADVFIGTKEDTKRMYYLNKANAAAQLIGDQKLLAMGSMHQMEWYYKQGILDSAYTIGAKTSKILQEENLPLLQVKNDTMMYAIAKHYKQPEKALSHLEMFTKHKLHLVEQNGRKQIEEIRARYELESKDLIIANQNLDIVASKRFNKIMLLLIALCCFVLFFLFFAYKKNKKIVQTIYKKEKEKDFEIKKLKERLASHSYRAIEEIALKDPEESYTTTPSKSLALFDKFEYILAKEQLYLNPELDQNLVVKILGTNKKYLYDAISEHSDLNFRGIINRMRINEAKKHMADKLKNNNTINFSTIYAECGFNSNSSFYRAFKLITGITPNDYATELKRELATVYKS